LIVDGRVLASVVEKYIVAGNRTVTRCILNSFALAATHACLIGYQFITGALAAGRGEALGDDATTIAGSVKV
jgi:hypothetical protein